MPAGAESATIPAMPNTALIVAQPGPVREALHSLAAAVPGLSPIWLAADLLQARTLAGRAPLRLVILGAGLSWASARALSADLRSASARVGVIILTDQEPPGGLPPPIGAEVVLHGGTPAPRLIRVLQELLAATA